MEIFVCGQDVYDFDANTEMGEIIHRLERDAENSEPDNQAEELKRDIKLLQDAKKRIEQLENENRQLIDDLAVANGKLSNIEKSILGGREAGRNLSQIMSEESVKATTWKQELKELPKVFIPHDDYPSPELTEEERKRIGLEYYLGVLKSAAEVRLMARGTPHDRIFKYGKLSIYPGSTNPFLTINNGAIGIQWGDGFELCAVISVQH